MLVAKSDHCDRIYSGPDVQRLSDKTRQIVRMQGFTCPSCGTGVEYTGVTATQPFNYFQHVDGAQDCFESESVSDSHRIATEITLQALHNRVRTVTERPVDIDVERWIGIRENFVIADIRVTAPLQVAAEVYYNAGQLALGRKLDTMFEHDYQTYLVFHTAGCHDVDRVEQYIRRLGPLHIGRFDPHTLEVTLGDLFSEQNLELDAATRDQVPNYIAR